MTPLLILIFGIQPTTAIGTDIFYSAITKTVGGWRHLRMKTVNMELVKWLAFGSVPAAVAGVALVSVLERARRRRPARLARLRGARRHPADGRHHHPGPGADPARPDRRARPLRRRAPPQGRRGRDRRHHRLRDRDHLGRLGHRDRDPADRRLPAWRRRKSSAPTSSTPRSCSGRPAIAHWVGGNVDFGLAGNILVGSIPGVVIGAALSDKAPQGFIRTALGVVLIGSGIVTHPEGRPERLADRRRGRRGRPRRGPLRAALAATAPARARSARQDGGPGCRRSAPDAARRLIY